MNKLKSAAQILLETPGILLYCPLSVASCLSLSLAGRSLIPWFTLFVCWVCHVFLHVLLGVNGSAGDLGRQSAEGFCFSYQYKGAIALPFLE